MFHRSTQSGFTYFGVLFLVTLISISLSGAAIVWHVEQQRQKEKELIFIGQQYAAAIASYYENTPGVTKAYPKKITDLLADKRGIKIKRHLRKPFSDPITGKSNWGLVNTNKGGFAGIYSLGQGIPLKQSGFEESLDEQLSGKSSYKEWKFLYIPDGVPILSGTLQHITEELKKEAEYYSANETVILEEDQ